MRPAIYELFAGAGGAFLGAHRAGLRCLEAVEYDPAACAALAAACGAGLLGRPHPAIGERTDAARCADVRRWSPRERAWGWWASPPCQRHSTAGNGTGPDGFPVLVDALARARRLDRGPRWVLMENVRGALSDGTVDEVVSELRRRFGAAGYWLVDCAELWLPQHRVRVVIWAGPRELPDLPMCYRPLTPAGLALGLWGVLDGGRNSAANPAQERPRTTDEPAQTVGTRGNLMLDSGTTTERGGGMRVPHQSPSTRPSPTVMAKQGTGLSLIGGGGNPPGPGRPHTGRRRLTVAECAVLQGFPAGWPWQGTREQQYRQVGNAVPPVLAEHAWRHVMRHDLEVTP